MSDEVYIAKKVPGRLYVSRAIDIKSPKFADGVLSYIPQKGRYMDTVLKDTDGTVLGTVEKQVTLRRTRTGKRQIKAFVIEEPRNVRSLTVQSFNLGTDGDLPSQTSHFSLRGDEIRELLKLAGFALTAQFSSGDKLRLDSNSLVDVELTDEATRALLKRNHRLLENIVQHDITERDLVAVAFRKAQLKRFERLLSDQTYFAQEQARLNVQGAERVWQGFFEENQWIFGGALFLTAASAIDPGKLERAVVGPSVAGPGKRVDALMRTRGRIGALCFVEIKTHVTSLLKDQPYRSGAWAISDELAGAIAQVQKTVELAERQIRHVLRPTDDMGIATAEEAFLFRPRSVVVCGDLAEFRVNGKVNEERFASFELFRRQVTAPDVVTFDELLERARLIVESSE